MAANETRGETEIKLEGVSYVMRPSWEAIDEFETATGKAATELYAEAGRDRLKLRDLAAIVGATVRAKGKEDGDRSVMQFRDDRICSILPGEEGGIFVATRAVLIVLLMAVTGGVDSSGKPKAAPTMTPVTEAADA